MYLEISEQEIQDFKKQWLQKTFDAMQPNVYSFKNELAEDFKSRFRSKADYSNKFYLTDDFKNELSSQLRQDVELIIVQYYKSQMKQALKSIVEGFLLENIEKIFEEVRADIKLTTGKFEAQEHEWFTQELGDVANGAYESGIRDGSR